MSILPYSVVEGLDPFYPISDMQSGYFRSERRCPECGRCLNTNGTGRFACPECDYKDKQDVSAVAAAGLGYTYDGPRKFVFGGK